MKDWVWPLLLGKVKYGKKHCNWQSKLTTIKQLKRRISADVAAEQGGGSPGEIESDVATAEARRPKAK